MSIRAALRLAGVCVTVGALAACGSARAADMSTAPPVTYVCKFGKRDQQEYAQPGLCPDGTERIDKHARLRVAILLFNDAEEIDFAGPLEAFGAAGATLYTVAKTRAPVRAAFGTTITPDFDFASLPPADVLLVPGGGVGGPIKDPATIEFIQRRAAQSGNVLSVCSGAFLVGKAGLLKDLSATATSPLLGDLARLFPDTRVVDDRRFVDTGKVITTAGLSAGIDGALHLIEKKMGRFEAEAVARYMEYEWRPGGAGSFAQLARLKLPPLATLVPADAAWQKRVDDGDTNHWNIEGRLGGPADPRALLDSSAKGLIENGWQLRDSSATQFKLVKATGDHHWSLNVELIPLAQARQYDLSMAVRRDDNG